MNTGRLRSDRWRSNSFLCVLLWFFYAIVLEGCYYDGFQKCLSVPGGKLPSLARYQKWGSSSSGGATTIFFMSRIRRNIIWLVRLLFHYSIRGGSDSGKKIWNLHFYWYVSGKVHVHEIASVATIDSGKNISNGWWRGNYYYRPSTMHDIDSFGCEYTKINMHDANCGHFDVQYKNGTVRKILFPIALSLISPFFSFSLPMSVKTLSSSHLFTLFSLCYYLNTRFLYITNGITGLPTLARPHHFVTEVTPVVRISSLSVILLCRQSLTGISSNSHLITRWFDIYFYFWD